MNFNPHGPIVVFDNLRSVYNTASLYRTMDCLGIFTACIIGTTPTPTDRYNRYRSDFSKVALGAQISVQTYYFATITEFLEAIKPFNYSLVCVEQSEKSIDYKSFHPPQNCAVVLGAEVVGVSKEFLDICNTVLELPQKGEKESLNVSIAGAIVLYRLFDI